MDRIKEFEEKVKPLIEKLAVVCHDYQIPMFVTTAIKDNGKETVYKSKLIDTDFINVELTDDKFKDLLNIMNGFKTYYPTTYEADDEILYE